MKKFIALAIAVVAFTGCFKSSLTSNFTSVCSFVETGYEQILGEDDYYFKTGFSDSNLALWFDVKLSEDKSEYLGGFSLSRLYEPKYEKGHESSMMSVADTSAFYGKIFLVYRHNRDKSLNPEHSVSFRYVDNPTCICKPGLCMVANTSYLVNLALWGADGIPPFGEGDYLAVKVTGILKGSENAPVSVSKDLMRYADGKLDAIIDWTKLDLEKLGSVSYIDFEVESNRTDIPLHCCVDFLTAKINLVL